MAGTAGAGTGAAEENEGNATAEPQVNVFVKILTRKTEQGC